MKRFAALLLTLTMLTLIAVPSVLAETEQPVETGQEAVLPEEVPEPSEEPAETGPEGLPAEETIEAVNVQNANTGKKTPANTATYIRFTDLRSVLEKYNTNIRYMKAAISDAGEVSTSDLIDAVDQLDQLSASLKTTLGQVQMAAADPDLPPDQQLVYGALSVALGANLASLKTQTASLESQIDNLDTTVETTQNTLRDAINQLVKGTETLYIGLITMDSAMGDVERGLEALDRAVAIVEKQVELGMASQYDAETIRHQRSSVQSQLESLQFQIKTNKITLEGMLGMALNGKVGLEPLTMPTEEELSAIHYENDLDRAMRQNVDVQNADAQRWADSGNTYDRQYDAAVDTFAYKFKIICLTVPEQQRLAASAQEAVDYQQRTFDIAAKKYELGMLSHEEYLSAENDLESAKSSLFSAQLDLFTAYRNYVYAKSYGIV